MTMCWHETREVFDRYDIVTGDDLRAAAAKLYAINAATGKVSGKVAPISGRRRALKSPKWLMRKGGLEPEPSPRKPGQN